MVLCSRVRCGSQEGTSPKHQESQEKSRWRDAVPERERERERESLCVCL